MIEHEISKGGMRGSERVGLIATRLPSRLINICKFRNNADIIVIHDKRESH